MTKTREQLTQEIQDLHQETCAAHERVEAYLHTLDSLIRKAQAEIASARDYNERLRRRLARVKGES